jgi:hypothetical protein
LGVEVLENRLVPASAADLANIIVQQGPLLAAIPQEHLTGAVCRQQVEQVRQNIAQVQWTPSGPFLIDFGVDEQGYDQTAFDQEQQAFLAALAKTEANCGADTSGPGGGGGTHGHPGTHKPPGSTGSARANALRQAEAQLNSLADQIERAVQGTNLALADAVQAAQQKTVQAEHDFRRDVAQDASVRQKLNDLERLLLDRGEAEQMAQGAEDEAVALTAAAQPELGVIRLWVQDTDRLVDQMEKEAAQNVRNAVRQDPGAEPAFFSTHTLSGRFDGTVDDNGQGGCTMNHAGMSGGMGVDLKAGGTFFNTTFRLTFAKLILQQRPGLCEDFSGTYQLQGQAVVSGGQVSFDLAGGEAGNGSAGDPASATIHFDGTFDGDVLSGEWRFQGGENGNDTGRGTFTLRARH